MQDLLLALSSPPPQEHRLSVLPRRRSPVSVLLNPPYLAVASPFHHLLGIWELLVAHSLSCLCTVL